MVSILQILFVCLLYVFHKALNLSRPIRPCRLVLNRYNNANFRKLSAKKIEDIQKCKKCKKKKMHENIRINALLEII